MYFNHETQSRKYIIYKFNNQIEWKSELNHLELIIEANFLILYFSLIFENLALIKDFDFFFMKKRKDLINNFIN